MDAIAGIKARIPQFAGYADLEGRREDDELVRSYLGEALSTLNANHPDFFTDRSEVYESLIIRAGFMNQLAFHSFEYAKLDPSHLEAVAQNDLAMLDLADKAPTIAAGEVAAYIEALMAAFDRRDAAMQHADGEFA
jgi:hypothetical protein